MTIFPVIILNIFLNSKIIKTENTMKLTVICLAISKYYASKNTQLIKSIDKSVSIREI